MITDLPSMVMLMAGVILMLPRLSKLPASDSLLALAFAFACRRCPSP
jgi:hypothetical protein